MAAKTPVSATNGRYVGAQQVNGHSIEAYHFDGSSGKDIDTGDTWAIDLGAGVTGVAFLNDTITVNVSAAYNAGASLVTFVSGAANQTGYLLVRRKG